MRRKIFRKVHCKAYMKQIKDGVHLSVFHADSYEPVTGSSWGELDIQVIAERTYYENGEWREEELADLSGFEGDSVHKVYRERVEEEFDGFLVGYTRVTTTGEIGTDTTMWPYNLSGDLEEVFHLFKNTHQEEVGVVYFKNNAKRYVLIEDIE